MKSVCGLSILCIIGRGVTASDRVGFASGYLEFDVESFDITMELGMISDVGERVSVRVYTFVPKWLLYSGELLGKVYWHPYCGV